MSARRMEMRRFVVFIMATAAVLFALHLLAA